MTSSQDTEITLGTGKLLFLFFGLVGICALFFALGYSLGRKSEPALASSSPLPAPQTSSSNTKSSGAAATQPMSFYKSVEQKDANPELTPTTETKTDSTASPAAQTTNPAQPANSANAADPTTTLPAPGYFVQVAAVSKQEDADALVDALKKKQYPAFVAAVTADKLFRVQVGPYSDVKDAEAMRTKLIGDGYSPILKR
ncbi:MAG TPA: SPOR domain-containing protein [Candidatus Solibacter sp.]|nr:SPOR domain-containing protein [Candidatus Solibacter sp.]